MAKLGSVRHNLKKTHAATQKIGGGLRVVNARISIQRTPGSYGASAGYTAKACLFGRKPGARKNRAIRIGPRGAGRWYERDRCGEGRAKSPTAALKKALRSLSNKKL